MLSKPVVLTIAGSDPGSGAGIQSDIKTFHNLGVYGVTVVTAITSQNTKGVQGSFEVPAKVISSQLKSVFDDFKIKVIKTGMLSSSGVTDAVYNVLKNKKNIKLIIDPVIYSKNRYELLNKNGIKSLTDKIIPMAYLITPNFHEAEILAGIKITGIEDMESACRILYDTGAKNVLIKGGHVPKSFGLPPGSDLLYSNRRYYLFPGEYIQTRHTHGIGCTYSAAIAANIASGRKLSEAIFESKKYIEKKLKSSLKIGRGNNPVEQ